MKLMTLDKWLFIESWRHGHYAQGSMPAKGTLARLKSMTEINGYDAEVERSPIYRGLRLGAAGSDNSKALRILQQFLRTNKLKLDKSPAESWSLDRSTAEGFMDTVLLSFVSVLLRKPKPRKGSVILNLASPRFRQDLSAWHRDEHGSIPSKLKGIGKEREIVVEQQCDQCSYKDVSDMRVNLNRRTLDSLARAMDEIGWWLHVDKEPKSGPYMYMLKANRGKKILTATRRHEILY